MGVLYKQHICQNLQDKQLYLFFISHSGLLKMNYDSQSMTWHDCHDEFFGDLPNRNSGNDQIIPLNRLTQLSWHFLAMHTKTAFDTSSNGTSLGLLYAAHTRIGAISVLSATARQGRKLDDELRP